MTSRVLWLGLGLIMLLTVLIGCERTPMDVLLPNQSPRVTLSAGPIRDSTNVFIATFNWNASDPDGQIDKFLFAIDDTSSVDSWFETNDFELTLFFTASDSARADSIFIGLSQVPLIRFIFNDAHTFFVKAVDDDGAESQPASLSFTAETLAPTTEIMSPPSTGIVSLGNTFTVRWEGRDPDGTEGPVGYSWRLVAVNGIVSLSDEEIEMTLLDPNSAGDPWSPFEPRSEVQLANLAVPGEYLFGVRALDQAGASEPRLRTFRAVGNTNVLLVRALETGGRPVLKVSSSVKTTDFPTGSVSNKTFQVPANSDVLFSWVADATGYGGTIASYSYGVDLDDLSQDNPGWAPESANLTQVRLNFSVPEGGQSEEHLFFVRVRDDVGTTLIADLNLVVVPLRFDRDVVYVDDWGRDARGVANRRNGGGAVIYPELDEPWCTSDEATTGDGRAGIIDNDELTSFGQVHDTCHDELIRTRLELALDNLGLNDWVVDRYEAVDRDDGSALFGEVDVIETSGYLELTGPVTLEQLARYKVVVWSHAVSDLAALKVQNNEGEDNFLAIYLEAGGRVWITGTGTYSRTRRIGSVGLAPFSMAPEDFPFRFLKAQSVVVGVDCVDGCFRNSGSSPQLQRENGFEAAEPSPMAAAEGFPRLEVTREPYGAGSQPNRRGVPSSEGMTQGLDINPRLSLFGGRLDTLYFYQSNGLLRDNLPSYMDNSATGLRYSGPDQGPLIMFGFPFFWLPNNELEGVMTAGLRWLIEN